MFTFLYKQNYIKNMLCLFVSEVASAIGESNNFATVDQTIHKVIERNFKDKYNKVLDVISEKKKLEKLVQNLDDKSREAVSKNITSIQSSSNKVKRIIEILEENRLQVPKYDVSLRKKEEVRDEVYKQNKTEQIDSLLSETVVDKKEIQQAVSHLPEDQQQLFIEKAFMERGKVLEDQVLNNLEKEKKIVITERNARGYKKTLTFDDSHSMILYGKIDGFDEEEKTLIEIKTRRNGLTTKMWRNEEIQMLCYMYLLGIERGILREQFNGKTKDYEVEFDESEWQKIEKKLKKFLFKVDEYLEDDKKLEKLIENVRVY